MGKAQCEGLLEASIKVQMCKDEISSEVLTGISADV